MFGRGVFRLLIHAFLVPAACALGGCADTRGGAIPYDRALGAPDEPKAPTLYANYKIAPLDKLSI